MPGHFARESCPSLNIEERAQNLNLVPYHLEGQRSDFHPDWLYPTMLYFTGYANTDFSLLPVAVQHFMPCATSHLCAVLELGTGPQRNPTCEGALIESVVTLAIALCYSPSYFTGSVPGTLQSLVQCLRSVFWVSVLV